MRLLSFIFILLFSRLVGCSLADLLKHAVSEMKKTGKPHFETQCPKVETVTNQEDQDIEKLKKMLDDSVNEALEKFKPVGPIIENDHVRHDQEDNGNEFTVPGSILLLYGLNLFKYEAFPKKISTASFEQMMDILMSSRGISEQLFQMKCSDLTKNWIMKEDSIRSAFNPRKYIIPDFLLKADSYPYALSTEDIYFQHSYQDIITSLKGQVKFETDLGFLGGSSSTLSFTKNMRTLKERNRKVVEASQGKKMATLMTQSDMRAFVTPEFVSSWKDLPDEYDEEKYEKFMDRFGTHYFGKADIGSCHYMRSETSTTYIRQYSEYTFAECAKLRLLNKESENENYQTNSEVYRQFTAKSEFSENYVTSGGMNRNDEEEWLNKWPTHPWVVSGHAMPVSFLIEDRRKSDNMRLALVVKQLRIFIQTHGEEIDRIINNYGNRIEHECQMEEDNNYYLPFSDGMVPSSIGNCDQNVSKDVNEMVCCHKDYSVKHIVDAYEEIKSQYESPTLTNLNNIRIRTEMIQVGLFDVMNHCFNCKRRDL